MTDPIVSVTEGTDNILEPIKEEVVGGSLRRFNEAQRFHLEDDGKLIGTPDPAHNPAPPIDGISRAQLQQLVAQALAEPCAAPPAPKEHKYLLSRETGTISLPLESGDF